MSQYKQLGYIYNPANQTYEQLRDGFVIRQREFVRILRELKSSELTTLSQHYLIEGQRGTGKTSLLLRIKYEIEHNDSLSFLLAIQLAEEQYGLVNLCRLWVYIAEELAEVPGFEALESELDIRAEEPDYAEECFYILEKYLKNNNKKLVLLLDNFGDVLDKFPDIEQMRLRDIFHSSAYIQLIASSSRTLEHTYKHDSPFYEFFKIIKLEGLNTDDTHKLLTKLAEVYNEQAHVKDIIVNQPGRIESIRRLTGGVPRTIVLMFEIFIDDSAEVFSDLENILDRVTPLYKHRMDDLPTEQQAIVDTIALHWDGVSALEVANSLKNWGFTREDVSAQLSQLVDNGLLQKKQNSNKDYIYSLQERFFNIWYLMRYGRRKNKNQVLWLVRFLQEWCNKDEIIQRAKRIIENAREGHLHLKAYYMAEAMAPLIVDAKLQHEFIHAHKEALREKVPDIDRKLTKSDIDIYKSAVKAVKAVNTEKRDNVIKKGDFISAITQFKKLINSGSSLATRSIFNLGYLYNLEENYELAIKYYQMAVNENVMEAMNNLGLLYENTYKENKKALEYYKKAAELHDTRAMYNMGHLYERAYKDYDEAILHYLKAAKKGHAGAMNNLAYLYEKEYKDYKKSLQYYMKAVKKDHINAMYNLAHLYEVQFKDYGKAIQYYKKSIQKGHTGAMNNLGYLYESVLRDNKKAVIYYTKAIKKGDANAMTALSWLYYTQAIEKDKCLLLSDKANSIMNNQYTGHIFATALLWNNQFQESIDKITEVLLLSKNYQNCMDDMTDYLLLLIAKKQFRLTHNLFLEVPDLKMKFKPIYYALMVLLKEEYPNEYLKMGTELEETVDEILDNIKEKANTYMD